MKKLKVLSIICMLCINLTGCDFRWNFEMLGDWLFKRNESVSNTNDVVIKTNEDIINDINNSINTTQESNKEFIFNRPTVKGVTEDTGVTVDYHKINIYLDEGIIYPVRVPTDSMCITNNESFIYARDSSFEITVLTDINSEKLADLLDANKVDLLSVTLVKSRDGLKGPQEAVVYIANNKVILLKTYNNSKAFRTILEGFMEESYKSCDTKELQIVSDITKIVDKLPLYTGYHMTAVSNLGDENLKMYQYLTGNLIISKETKDFYTTKEVLSNKVAAVNENTIISTVYENNNIYYVEVGNYTLGVYKDEQDVVYSCYGYGEEARFNVIKILQAQM